MVLGSADLARAGNKEGEDDSVQQPDTRQTPPILVLLVHNVVSFEPFRRGFAQYWTDRSRRPTGIKGCTVLQAVHCDNQMAVIYNMEDTPQQLAAYQAHLTRPGRAGNMQSMGVVLEGARAHVLQRIGDALQVQEGASRLADGEVLLVACCRVANYNLWRAWWDGVADCRRCLPARRCAAYSSVDHPRQQVAMAFTTASAQLPKLVGWLEARRMEMAAASIHMPSARVYALKVVDRHSCS